MPLFLFMFPEELDFFKRKRQVVLDDKDRLIKLKNDATDGRDVGSPNDPLCPMLPSIKRDKNNRLTDVLESNNRMSVTLMCYRSDPTTKV